LNPGDNAGYRLFVVMIYHCIRYTIDSSKVADFETYARRWMDGGIIKRCGGDPLGYFLPKKGYGGADNIAMTLIGFESLSAYEKYREKLVADPEAKENVEFAKRSGFILIEDRSYFYRV
jgi:NIPSNAP protein